MEDEDDEYMEDDILNRQMRMERQKMLRQGEGEIGDEDHEMEDVLDYEDVKGKVSTWV
jgi:hypothetical protein